MNPPEMVSRNFTVAKTWAILVVTVAHFLPDTPMWVLAQLALFVFAFASAYFTSTRYPEVRKLGSFWHKKIVRLGLPLLVIDLFLLLVFALKGTPGIFSLHTPLALVGLSGFYDWLGIRNQSPYGYGLWFLTVLLLFYTLYPWLATAFRRSPRAALAGIGALCLAGMHWAPMPYALWPTVFGFAYGLYVGLHAPATAARIPLLVPATLTALVALLALNLAGIKSANPALLVVLSVLLVHLLLQAAVPRWLDMLCKPFQDCVLEIYVIHTYLFLPGTSLGTGLALLASLSLILLCAIVLHRLTEFVEQRLPRMSPTHKSIPS